MFLLTSVTTVGFAFSSFRLIDECGSLFFVVVESLIDSLLCEGNLFLVLRDRSRLELLSFRESW